MTVISSDDLLFRVHRLNKVIKSQNLTIYNPDNPEHVHGDADTIMMVASDVCALFPSMNKEETSIVCGMMMETSDIEVENVDYKEVLLYLRMNQTEVDLEDLEGFLPVRRFKMGGAPGMKNDQVKGPHRQKDILDEKLL